MAWQAVQRQEDEEATPAQENQAHTTSKSKIRNEQRGRRGNIVKGTVGGGNAQDFLKSKRKQLSGKKPSTSSMQTQSKPVSSTNLGSSAAVAS